MKLESFLEYPIPTELRKAAKKDSSFIARMERYLVSGGAALPLHGKSAFGEGMPPGYKEGEVSHVEEQ